MRIEVEDGKEEGGLAVEPPQLPHDQICFSQTVEPCTSVGTNSILPSSLPPDYSCSFQYDLDSTGLRSLGNGTGNSGGGAGSLVLSVDTTVIAGPPLVTSNTSATLVFGANVLGARNATVATAVLANTTMVVRLDDTPFFTQVAVGAAFSVQGLSEGTHVVEARAR